MCTAPACFHSEGFRRELFDSLRTNLRASGEARSAIVLQSGRLRRAMGFATRWLLVVFVCGASLMRMAAQFPDRPPQGAEVLDPVAINAQNGVLQASLSLGHSVDAAGYTHYCYQYQSPTGMVEAPTLRLNPGDRLRLSLTNAIADANASKMKMQHAAPGVEVCGDGGEATVSSTNVHFHGMPIPPTC